ncbi:MAG: hypothetical protein N2645_16000 [Clostridia bacterium]|nr:hypothetical protein [Clostridia bacterium]
MAPARRKTKTSEPLRTVDWKSIIGLVSAIIYLIVEIIKRL